MLVLTNDTVRMLVGLMRENIRAAENGRKTYGGLDPFLALANNVDWLERQWHEQAGISPVLPRFYERVETRSKTRRKRA
jgi:hypothetical protein